MNLMMNNHKNCVELYFKVQIMKELSMITLN